jgi:hypothetical protein
VDDGHAPAFIMRFVDGERIVFMCAAVHGWATAASVLYLLKSWKALLRTWGGYGQFGVPLKCRKPGGNGAVIDIRDIDGLSTIPLGDGFRLTGQAPSGQLPPDPDPLPAR